MNRGAELAGVSTERFKNELAERGLPREAVVLDVDENGLAELSAHVEQKET